MRRGRLLCVVGVVALAAIAMPRRAQAQFYFTQLTVSGFPLTNTGPAVLDFEAGSVALGATDFSVNLILNFFGSFSPRVTTVAVRCNTPCPASGVAPVASLQWRRSDLAAWNSITTSFVNIETRTATFSGTNDPWGNTLFWRYLLSYTGSPPTAATQFNIQYQLTVTAP